MHSITLIVQDTHTCFDTLTKPNYVLVAKPTDNFSMTPTTICGPATVNFTDASTDVPGTAIVNYSWTFGDGAVNTNGGATPNHLYSNPGTYTVQSIVTDNLGCKDTLNHPVKVTVYRPLLSYIASTTNLCAYRTVHFNNTSTLASGYLWVFGDGATSTVAAPDHIYTTSGSYTVKLIGFESHGCSDTLVRTNYITINPSPRASFVMDDSFAVCPPLNVHFTNLSTGFASNTWAFGDGGSSFATNPAEPYTAPGLYTVRLAVKSSNGCTDTAYGHVNIFGYKGAFKYTPLTGCGPLGVHFNASLSTVAYVSWDFADGIVSSSGISDTISHTYTTPGSYIPKLILTDTSSKCSAFSVGADTIKVDTLTPDFTMAPATACQGSTVTFKDASKSLFSPPNTWSWTFGGGGTSTLAANLHVFTSTGTLPVTLNVTNAYGCSGTITKNVVINPPPSPISGKMTICEGGTTPLTDATGGGSWSSANTTVATVDPFGVVSGVFAGTATIVYTSISGCTASAVVKVNPNPKPITGATGVCFGLTTQLSDATPSGFWTSSNTAIAAIGTSGTVTTVATGTTTISYILPTGCLTSVTVNVATSPVTISGNLAVCLGSTSGLSDTVAGGTWTSGNTIIATIGSTSGIVNGLSLGATLVTYSIGTGCSITGTVTVIPVPANITGPTNVCAGSTIALTDGTLGGRWTSTNTSVATVGSGSAIVTGKAGGLDTINYTMSTGCMATLAISVNAATPIIGSSYVCKSYSTTLSDAISPGTWSSSNSAIASIIPSTGVVTGNSVGNVVIKYVNTYGCGVSMIFSVITQPADITGATAGVCAGHSVALSDATPFGTWSSSNTSIAWVDPVTGMATGYVSGTVLISYTVGASGCAIVTNLTVNPNYPIYGPNSMCVGQSVTLMDTVLGGTWSSANSSIASVGITNGITTGVSGGTTTISYTMRTGCVQTYSVTAIPLPPAITGVNHVCPGFTQPLFNSLPGGTWSSSNMLVATIGSTGVVTGNSAGTTTITYVGGGCPITMTFTVNPLPAPITGNNISCFGSSTKLSDASGGGTWASSNGLIATIGGTSGILTGARLGTVTITYTLPTGCYAVKPEIINPPPAGIMGTPRVCEGLTTGFSDFTTGGTWSNDNTLIATIDGLGMATGVKAGTSIITYTAAGCGAYLTLTVNPLPQRIPDTMVCEGAAITLTNVFTGGTWTSGTSLVATAGITSGLITGVTSGVAAITYKLGTGCQTVTAVTVNPAPAPITGTPLVCATLTTQLSDASGSGTWSSGTSSIASVDLAGLVTGNSPGTALISYTIPTGCFNAVAVQVYPFPKIITGSSNLCQYTPVTFSDSVTGGTWSSDNTSIAVIGTSSGIVNGVALGTTTITYTVASSCSTTKAVSVIPLPAVFPITGGGTYCSADTGLHVGLGGSVIGTDYFLYEGTSIPTGPLAGTNNPLDFGLQKVPGTYSVVAVIAATGCSTPMSGTVTVSVVPTVVPSIKITSSGKDTICNGSKVNFAATVVNGGSTPAYAWYVNGTKVSITSAYAYIPADKDIVTVRLLSSAACAEPDTASETRVMKVMSPTTPSAVLSSFPGDTICLGQKISFTIEPSYGGSSPTYSWMVNTARVATGPTFTYVPTKGDIVYAEMKSNYICRTVDSVPSNSVAVSTVEPIVPTATVRATPGENIGHGLFDTLTAYPVNAGASPTYQWLINGYPVAGATNSTFITNEFSTDRSDSVTCEVTSSGICKITTHAWIYITVNFLGVNNATGENDLNIIPNPNKGEFTLKGAIGTATNEDVTLEMTDLLGQMIYKRTIAAPGGAINEKILLGNTVANGMYLLNVRSGSGTKVFHVVLER